MCLKMNNFQLIFLKNISNYYIRVNKYSAYSQMLANRKNKRGSILNKMIVNKDKNKKWYLNLMEKSPTSKSVFEHVHRPNKRQNMLNSLFIKNISDVLSTGDIAPDIHGYGVEINGVKVSPCFKVLNVYWQIPPNSFEFHEKIALALGACAPKLRAELISRNVMGKVPHIFFIRDITNAKVAEFENALKDADLGPEDQLSILPDDSFTENLLKFKTPKTIDIDEKKKEKIEGALTKAKNTSNLPLRPANMKSNVFGLNYDILMTKVLALKSKGKSPPKESAVISSEFFPSAELFDKIPGTPLQPGIDDREKILKKFQIERKMMRNAKTNYKISKEDSFIDENIQDESIVDDRTYDGGDYVEEETPENPFR